MSIQQDLQTAIELARGAGQIVMKHYGQVARLTKRNAEAVTEADRASQRFIVAGLRKQFPGDGIIGEESDTGLTITCECPDPMGRVWVIDPIDGTNNFIAGFDNFAVCIGLLDKGRPRAGVVFDVTRNRMYSAAAGLGAHVDERRVHVLKTPLGPSTILMITSNLIQPDGTIGHYVPRWLSQNEWKIRCMGSAALEAVAVAAGIAHGALTVNGKLWDMVAPAAIVLEAGGKVTDLAGKDLFPVDLRNYEGAKVPFVAAAPEAQERLLREIGEGR